MRVVKILLLGTYCLLSYGGLSQFAVGQQRQHFRTSPEDQHVVEGSVAIIKCEVGNLAGRVQWAKDGFVLGFNRTIPGYPRYEMVGEEAAGEHHLRIHNTSIDDDADYQCQVGPSDGHPPIRATGHLTVLLAPTKVELVGLGGEKVIEVREGEELTLECRVEDAKPVAEVKWYKNDKEIPVETREDTHMESSQRLRHHLVSKVNLRLSANDDESHYACVAYHPALNSPMRASVKISVQYPPGPPVITGYTEGETIRAGEKRTLTCRSRGGNPLGQVVWYRNNEIIDGQGTQDRGESVNDYSFTVNSTDNGAIYTCEVRNKLTDKPLLASVKLIVHFPPDRVILSGPSSSRVGDNVTLSCSAENSNPPADLSWVVDSQPWADATTRQDRAGRGGWHAVSTVVITVPPIDRDMMFTCHATNQALGETKVDTYILNVIRPPQPPVLHGYSEGVGIRVGSSQRITCVSRGGNPAAHLQWYRNGLKIPSTKHSTADVSYAEIEIKAEAKDNGAQYRCETHNSASPTPVSVATTLIVYFPPETVTITKTPNRLSAGTQATLTCTAGSSNPPAVITWHRGGYTLTGHLKDTSPTPSGGTSVTSELVVNLTAEDDGATYTCQATNTALSKDVRQAVTLHVNYPPTFLSEPPLVVDVVEGESHVLNLTARANPAHIQYTWSRRGAPLSKPVINESWRAYMTDADNAVVMGPIVEPDGPVLYIRDVSLDLAGDYELEATNEEGVTTVKIKLNVLYPPKIKYTSKMVTVSEGQDATLECAADGNPMSQETMQWTREGYLFSSRTQQTYGGSKAALTVTRANKNDTGVFTCLVDNGIGDTVMENVTLIVKTKPVIYQTQMNNRAAAERGTTGRMYCEAEGAPDVRFSWKRAGHLLSNGFRPEKYDNETEKTGLVSWRSTFYIHDVNDLDYSSYECVAENDLGASTAIVKFSRPTRPDPPLSLKIVNSTHDTIMLTWTPGFDGGKQQYFRLRYLSKGSSTYQFADVYEPGVYTYPVSGLSLGTEYSFSIMSYNDFGDSEYRGEFVKAFTRSEAPPTPGPTTQVGKDSSKLPGLWVVIIVLVATALLALNVSAIVCIVRRRRNKRASPPTKKTPPPSVSASTLPKPLPISPSQDGSDQASSKSTTNTMYAPSSYNDTMAGETLSSISEKSRESYAQDDSVVDYEAASHFYSKGHLCHCQNHPPQVISSQLMLYDQYDLLGGYEQTHKHAASTYLIDQIEPPPEYASQTPSAPSSAAYDPHEDDYAEVLRRNAYNHQLGKVTPRPPSRATHYTTSPDARGYLSYSYTPSPTTVPNGAAQYHAGGPSVTLGLHDHPQGYPADMGANMSAEGIDHAHALQTLGLDSDPPPSLGLEQHSLLSEHPSLTLDPHSITIDHPVIAVTDFSKRNGDLRVQPTSLSTFNPNPSPSTFSESDLEGHLV